MKADLTHLCLHGFCNETSAKQHSRRWCDVLNFAFALFPAADWYSLQEWSSKWSQITEQVFLHRAQWSKLVCKIEALQQPENSKCVLTYECFLDKTETPQTTMSLNEEVFRSIINNIFLKGPEHCLSVQNIMFWALITNMSWCYSCH